MCMFESVHHYIMQISYSMSVTKAVQCIAWFADAASVI